MIFERYSSFESRRIFLVFGLQRGLNLIFLLFRLGRSCQTTVCMNPPIARRGGQHLPNLVANVCFILSLPPCLFKPTQKIKKIRFRFFIESICVLTEAQPVTPQELIEDAREGRFALVLVYKLDRLGRDARMILNTVDTLQKSGVGLRSMTEEFDTTTASGRLMLTMLSGFAAHEREVIRERSIAGTKRLAHAGAWLGGIVPFGYRQEGEKRDARLVIADSILPEVGVSEAEVVRRIYRMAGLDRLSCRAIAERLNALAVPCVYTRDDRLLLRGKRRQRTCGIWRPGRIRNLIANSTYKGLHEYGKRSPCREKSLITREVPAIVPAELWEKAQQTMADNFLFGARSTKNRYLLRGLMKCRQCALTYIGMRCKRPNGKVDFYYRCNGKHSARQIFGTDAKRCASKDLNGTQLESSIWSDVERFVNDPGEVMNQLAAKLSSQTAEVIPMRRTPEQITQALADRQEERNRVLAIFRRGRIDEASLEEQLRQIEAEEERLRSERRESSQARQVQQSASETVLSAEELLRQLRVRVEQGISWDLKRQLIEILVDGAEIETIQGQNGREAVVSVRYRFNSVSSDCTDTDS